MTTLKRPWNYGRGQSIADIFWKNTAVLSADECWPWTGNTVGNGYGNMSVWKHGRCKGFRAHRVSWELHFGAVPKGLNVLHRCDNPGCVNPAHLWLGTHADNVADKVKKGRQAVGESHGSRTKPHRKPQGERHGMHVLTYDQILAIRTADTSVRGAKAKLAKQFHTSKTNITRIIAKTIWKTIS